MSGVEVCVKLAETRIFLNPPREYTTPTSLWYIWKILCEVIRLFLNGGVSFIGCVVLTETQSKKEKKRRSVLCSLLWTSFTQLTNSLWEESERTTSIIHTTTLSLPHHSPFFFFFFSQYLSDLWCLGEFTHTSTNFFLGPVKEIFHSWFTGNFFFAA